MNKIKVGAVSYLNTKPLLYGITNNRVIDDIELVVDYPANIAQLLLNNDVDMALIPVAVLSRLTEWHIVSDYCIGTNGAVASVCIFSQVPMNEIKTVLLDYQSRTSVNLARILLKEFWQQDVKFIHATGENYRTNIQDNTAAVVIGDRALEQRQYSKYMYDLGLAWKEHTGLPFVFAAWISNKKLPGTFIERFNQANREGLENIALVVAQTPFAAFDLATYYAQNISYDFDAEKKKGLNLFLKKLAEHAL